MSHPPTDLTVSDIETLVFGIAMLVLSLAGFWQGRSTIINQIYGSPAAYGLQTVEDDPEMQRGFTMRSDSAVDGTIPDSDFKILRLVFSHCSSCHPLIKLRYPGAGIDGPFSQRRSRRRSVGRD